MNTKPLSPPRRVHFNPRSVESALSAALRLVDMDAVQRYVYPTYRGFVVTRLAPPPGQRFYVVSDPNRGPVLIEGFAGRDDKAKETN